jgi:hypothetical protein
MTARGLVAAPLLLAAIVIGLATRNSSKSRPSQAPAGDDRLRKLAEKVSQDPGTTEWVRSAREALAAGTLGPALDADELRARIAGLRAGGR